MNKFDPTCEPRLKAALGLHAILFMRDPKKELDNARVLLYFKALEEYDIEDVEAACYQLQKKLRKFPHPVDIVEECEAIVRKRDGAKMAGPPPMQPGDKPWCEECQDSGTVIRVAPAREKRDIRPDDPTGDQVYSWAGACSCREHNPVFKWKALQNRAGVVRSEEKQGNNWSPNRRGQLVKFQR